jgi:RimJ/RimL family protein N-acetyltransferase
MELVPLDRTHAKDALRLTEDPEIRRLTGTHRTFTLEQIESWADGIAQDPTRIDLAIIVDGRYVGDLALTEINPDNRSAGLRIALVEPGKGYGTEAIRMVLSRAFGELQLHRVSLEVFEYNERAIAAYRKCGFVEEGRMRDALRWDGRWYDALLMSVLSTDSI